MVFKNGWLAPAEIDNMIKRNQSASEIKAKLKNECSDGVHYIAVTKGDQGSFFYTGININKVEELRNKEGLVYLGVFSETGELLKSKGIDAMDFVKLFDNVVNENVKNENVKISIASDNKRYLISIEEDWFLRRGIK